MIKKQTIYVCDVCKKEVIVEKDTTFSTVEVPGYRVYSLGESRGYPSSCRRDICEDCYQRILDILEENGVVFREVSGIGNDDRITWKPREEKKKEPEVNVEYVKS